MIKKISKIIKISYKLFKILKKSLKFCKILPTRQIYDQQIDLYIQQKTCKLRTNYRYKLNQKI